MAKKQPKKQPTNEAQPQQFTCRGCGDHKAQLIRLLQEPEGILMELVCITCGLYHSFIIPGKIPKQPQLEAIDKKGDYIG